jgi:hypothetical protein
VSDTFTTIQFGDYLNVTDLGGGTIRVDGCGPGSGASTVTQPVGNHWPHPGETVISTGDSTVTLPDAVGIKGQSVTVKNGGTGITTVARTNAQTIDGKAEDRLLGPNEFQTYTSDGANWLTTADNTGGVDIVVPDPEDPDETPVDTRDPIDEFLDGPESPDGWHYRFHYETAWLFDSSPGRFDVPSRKWTRVPFSAVRIMRHFELEPGGTQYSAWLPDDRGAGLHATNGILHVTDAMSYDPGVWHINGPPGLPDRNPATRQIVGGWYSLEFPIADIARFPNAPDNPMFDYYIRAARIFNQSTGKVLPNEPGSSLYCFMEWPFDQPADGLEGINPGCYFDSSPQPLYRFWANRPMSLPGGQYAFGYPSYGNDPAGQAASVRYYEVYTGERGGGNVAAETAFAAGANLCLHAWQDSPWTIPFGTNKYPGHKGWYNDPGPHNKPYLRMSYLYDPDSIDHVTGHLL